MCQTVEETVQQQHGDNSKLQSSQKLQESSIVQKPSNPDDSSHLQDSSDSGSSQLQEVCPPDCPCRSTGKSVKSSLQVQILFNVLGILFALFAIYLMVTTDSNLYLIFWICFSVLRRMMGKTRSLKMKKD